MNDRVALKRIEPRPLEYRFYYNKSTGVGVLKNVGEHIKDLSYIVIDKAMYDSIDFCSKYKVIDGHIIGQKVEHRYKTLSIDPNGKFRTTKNNMIFCVGNNEDIAIDTWNYIHVD